MLVAIDIQINDFTEYFGGVEDNGVVCSKLCRCASKIRGKGLVLITNVRMRRSVQLVLLSNLRRLSSLRIAFLDAEVFNDPKYILF
jgi:hypothetical protein